MPRRGDPHFPLRSAARCLCIGEHTRALRTALLCQCPQGGIGRGEHRGIMARPPQATCPQQALETPEIKTCHHALPCALPTVSLPPRSLWHALSGLSMPYPVNTSTLRRGTSWPLARRSERSPAIMPYHIQNGSRTGGGQMKVIVPVAGKGTRLRPHTHTKPKSLVRVAGKPILGHLRDRLRSLSMEQLILVIDPDEAKEASIREFLETTAPVPVQYVRQTELKGPAHAIFLAREHIDRDVLIVFNDTLFDADLSQIERHHGDGMIWVREVDD